MIYSSTPEESARSAIAMAREISAAHAIVRVGKLQFNTTQRAWLERYCAALRNAGIRYEVQLDEQQTDQNCALSMM